LKAKIHLIFALATFIAAAMVFPPLRALLSSAARSEYYSHILLIPLVSLYLLFLKRKRIFQEPGSPFSAAWGLVILGIAGYGGGWLAGDRLGLNDQVALQVAATLVAWAGVFLLLYGRAAFAEARFAILFLVFMIPIPERLMEGIIYLLQVGSTEVTYYLFTLAGIPFYRDGFTFQMAGTAIEVAKQCSGIRSSLALFITAVLAGYLFLNRGWTRTVLALVVFPITIFKNGVRIMTLTLLAIHVDQRFLIDSFLHRSGGFIFYVPALILLGLAIWLLRKAEKKSNVSEKFI
jgi:exosortase